MGPQAMRHIPALCPTLLREVAGCAMGIDHNQGVDHEWVACLVDGVRAGAQRERVGQRPDALPLQLGVLQQRRADLQRVQVLGQPAVAGRACPRAAPLYTGLEAPTLTLILALSALAAPSGACLLTRES